MGLADGVSFAPGSVENFGFCAFFFYVTTRHIGTGFIVFCSLLFSLRQRKDVLLPNIPPSLSSLVFWVVGLSPFPLYVLGHLCYSLIIPLFVVDEAWGGLGFSFKVNLQRLSGFFYATIYLAQSEVMGRGVQRG